MPSKSGLRLRPNFALLSGYADLFSGLALVGMAGIAFFEARHLPFGSLGAPDAGFFPLSLAALLFVFALVIVLNGMAAKAANPEFGLPSWHVAVVAAAFVVYALSLAKVGFVLGTIAVMLLVTRGLGGVNWTRALAISVPGVLLTYFAFTQLGVPLPRGPVPF